MKKVLSFLSLLFVFIWISGCTASQSGAPKGEKPPKAYVVTDHLKKEMILGTYCWKNTCVDKIGPIGLTENEEPLIAKPGERIQLELKSKPLPNVSGLYLVETENEVETEVTLTDDSFEAPAEEGRYIYSYSNWWMDTKEKNVSHADAFYAFVIEVKEEE